MKDQQWLKCSQLGGDLGDLGLDALMTHLGADLLLDEPFLALGVLEDKTGSSLHLLADGLVLADNLGSGGVLSDASVSCLEDFLEGLASKGLLRLGELLLEGSGVLTLEEVVVLLDVDAHDVLEMLLSREVSLRLLLLGDLTLLGGNSLGLLPSETGESLLVVRDVETTVTSTLHGTEDTVTSGGADETNIEESLEGASLVVLVGDVVKLAVGGTAALELSVDLLVLEKSAGKEETSGVGGGVVGETGLDTEGAELLGVSSAHGHVTLDGGVDDAAENASVGHTDDHSVLLGVVLVLVVDHQSLTGVVVGLTLSSTSEFGLVPLGVRLVLKNLYKAHVVFLFVFNNVNLTLTDATY